MNDVTGPGGSPSADAAAPTAAVPDGRAARRLAAEQAQAVTPASAPEALSRTERRRLEGEQTKAVQQQHALWKAWWFYLLLAAVAVAVVMGVRSAADSPPPAPGVTTIGN